jgi:membrane-bound inhibitor of C-type lysozyme
MRTATSLALCLWVSPVFGADLTISLPGATPIERTIVPYFCQGLGPLRVEYINVPPNALAVVPVDGDHLIFTNVLSGSGARYAAGPYIWWIKGDSAQLSDLRLGGDAKPAECKQVSTQ